ncbi:MAG TPA: GNAT family N-acetyltransferase [Planctomycetota bacterium]|nr:GNAT family N-acetyltransferase [Planctomycetota bacterium]
MSKEVSLEVRSATLKDVKGVLELYRAVAKNPGGIARDKKEISEGYIKHLVEASLKRGLMIVAQETGRGKKIRGSIHAYRPNPLAFRHMLSSLTIVIHPDFQGQGVGRQVFSHFLETIQKEHPDVLRVELIVRESNLRGILLYETLGFLREGRMENRIRSATGGFEADIAMAWFNPKFRG